MTEKSVLSSFEHRCLKVIDTFRIKRFFGTSENAVKSQVWIAVATYVLVAIVRKRLKLDCRCIRCCKF